MVDTIEVFLQGPGIPQIVLVNMLSQGKVRDLIEVAREKGLKLDGEQALEVWLENAEEPLNLDATFKKAGIVPRCRVHIHTCRRVEVTVNYNGKSEQHPFPPSTTVGKVKQWADKKFGLSATDVTEHVLQLCGSTNKPSDDVQIGAFTEPRQCTVCFDLIPKERVEG